MSESSQSNDHETTRLRRAVEELSVLNELAAEIGSARTVDEILQTVIRRARRAAGADEGVITLVGEQAKDPMQTLVRTRERTSAGAAFSPNDILLQWMRANRTVLVLNDPRREGPLVHSALDPAVRSLISVPMMVGGQLIGILTLYNKLGGLAFESSDARLLSIMAGQSAHVIENANLAEQRERVIRMFGQHTSPEIVDELMRHGPELAGRRVKVTIMFADVRGFSTFAEQTSPEEVVGYLNKLFELTIESVKRHHGIIHQLLGDGLMAVFGAPISYGSDSLNAVRAALEMLVGIEKAAQAGLIRPMQLGLGLHTGEVVAGMVGTSIHREYKVTGDTVNLAARIEQMNKDFDSSLLISDAVYRELDRNEFPAVSLGDLQVRGREEPVHVYRLR